MSTLKNFLPEKIFNKDVNILLIWSMPIGLILILLIVFGTVMVPRVEEIFSLKTQIETVSREMVQLNQKRIYLVSLDQADLASKSLLVENGVLSEKNSYLLIKIIGKVVADFGYTVGDFTVSLGDVKEIDKTVASFAYQKVPVEVTITGPKSNFLKMVNGIENSLPVISIDNFNMTAIGDVATIKMSVSAYYLPDWNLGKLETLTVSDLTPSKEESTVLAKIGSYKYYGAAEGEISRIKETFVPSNRVDPFY